MGRLYDITSYVNLWRRVFLVEVSAMSHLLLVHVAQHGHTCLFLLTQHVRTCTSRWCTIRSCSIWCRDRNFLWRGWSITACSCNSSSLLPLHTLLDILCWALFLIVLVEDHNGFPIDFIVFCKSKNWNYWPKCRVGEMSSTEDNILNLTPRILS